MYKHFWQPEALKRELMFSIFQNMLCLYLTLLGPSLSLGRTSFTGMLKVVLSEPPFLDRAHKYVSAPTKVEVSHDSLRFDMNIFQI